MMLVLAQATPSLPPFRDAAIAALVGMFAAIGLYHLVFYGMRRHASENLWFALLSLSVGMLGLCYSAPLFSAIFPGLARFRGMVLAEVVAGVSIALLIRTLFNVRFRWWETAALLAFTGCLPAALILPMPELRVLHYGVDVVVLLGVVILVSRVVVLARGNAPLARLVLGGIAVFGFCVLADLLAEYGAIPWVRLVPGAPGAFWGGFLLLIFTFGVATAQRWTLSEMQAGIDPLTGLASRRVLDDELAAEVERVKAGGRSCLLLIDLDGFKRVNDVHGHVKGDEVLRCVGLLLRQHARPGDLAARLGGEEMAVLLRDVDLPRARELAERLRAAVEVMTVPIPGGALSVTASVGVAAAVPGHDKTALVHAADRALYMAKAQGRNRVIAA